MRKFAIALFIAILIAGQFLTPVAAAAPPAWQASGSCGDTYTVHRGDYLIKIARICGTTLSNILALNPQIRNPSLIFAGMVLRLTGSVPQQKCGDTYTVRRGDYLVKIARLCGTTLSTILALNPQIRNPSRIFAGMVLRLAGRATPTGRVAQVSLSTTRAEAGDEVTVSVSGFPPNANIDYRIGQKGKSFSAAYDGKTRSNGTASKTITIPSSADEGEYWVVRVLTTELVNGVDITSHTIFITD